MERGDDDPERKKQARKGDRDTNVELQAGPKNQSETRGADAPDSSEGGQRGDATVDVPIPPADAEDYDEFVAKRARLEATSPESCAASSSQGPSRSDKRKFDGLAGDDHRADDTKDPEETNMQLEEIVPDVLMLGEKKRKAGRLGEGLHAG